MRTALALVALLGLAAPANAEIFQKCTGEGSERVTFTIDNSTFVARLDAGQLLDSRRIERFEFMGPAGMGLNGFSLQNEKGEGERLYVLTLEESARIAAADNPGPQEIWIFRDRAYWPCAAEPIRDRKPVVLMRDAMLNAPPETPFGTAMGAFGAASADAFPADNVPYCSVAFEKPAKLVFSPDGGLLVTIGDKTTAYSGHEPLGGPSDEETFGMVLIEGEDGSTFDESAVEAYWLKIGETEVVIFRDRVFWPCDFRHVR